jgi:hypothetical protein
MTTKGFGISSLEGGGFKNLLGRAIDSVGTAHRSGSRVISGFPGRYCVQLRLTCPDVVVGCAVDAPLT